MLPSQNCPAASGHASAGVRHASTPARAILGALLLLPLSGVAQQATPDTAVGDTVTHPVTGEDSVVIQVLPGYAVVTDTGDVFLIHTTAGYVLQPDDPATEDVDESVTIESVTTNADTGLIESITLSNGDTLDVARPAGFDGDDDEQAEGAPGGAGGQDVIVPAPGDEDNWERIESYGGPGADGDDGWGSEVCDPTGWFSDECAFVGDQPTNGQNGGEPDDIDVTFDASHDDITSLSADRPGIAAVSYGGPGGQGGDLVGNGDAGRGGSGGPGGTVNVTSFIDISTNATGAHGIFGQSRAGTAGPGGEGYIFGQGGGGGPAGRGGNVTVTHHGTIGTQGAGSHGLYVISTGGAAGSGGDSWGIVGQGGSSLSGGTGGNVHAINAGSIVTTGADSHGILAQSIGGTGGDGGDAGALVGLGGSGSIGGNGGIVRVTNRDGAIIETHGGRSIGVLAQSIGGGGGNGGTAGGLAAFGGSGDGGGSGSIVIVTNEAGSFITTFGAGSHGVLAQSIGGGGGAGASAFGGVALGARGGSAGNGGTVMLDSGANVTTSGTGARGLVGQSIGGGGGSASGNIGGLVTVGGQAGSGGAGGAVAIDNGGVIRTSGTGSDAILAQSIGGGGGSAGSTVGAVTIGGKSSGGGSAARVTVTNGGTLETAGVLARGIVAQSIGGGGGSAGSSAGGISIGGSGGAGGNGGEVNVTNHGRIETQGLGATAILAQSIGGGGGSGGTSGGGVGVGGTGDTGGSAAFVEVSNTGTIQTAGDFARGIFAQSIGGGGGTGGYGGGLFAVGGSGSRASAGGAVSVTNEGRIATAGLNASAIFAQSIGGGGGDGGSSGGEFLTIGGSGDGGGRSDTVTVASSGDLVTTGEDSHGIFAQSIGGGGGNGGSATGASLFAGVSIGGDGGAGGNGATVNVTTSERVVDIDGVPTSLLPVIHTSGARSHGINAQSVGGGGGSGGFAVQATAGTFLSVAVALGGEGSGGGSGGKVDVDSHATILTDAEDSHGILAQSVGGGGGNGGFAVAGALQVNPIGGGAVTVGIGGDGGTGGTGGAVDLDFSGNVVTLGDRSRGILAQSIGGGGGNGGFSVSGAVSVSGVGDGAITVGLGGDGGIAGNGALVDGDVNARVRTEGEHAAGVHFQSVGGGGGNGGFNIAAALSGAGVGSGAIGVGLGGSGGAGGTGGEIRGTVNGEVETSGDRSAGIIVQSIGGGGGNGGFNITVAAGAAGIGSGSIGVGLGGDGAGGGAGGKVDAALQAAVITRGADSDGVLVQSVGGGGGNGGFSITAPINFAGVGNGAVGVSLGGSAAGGGLGETVDARFTGTIATSGDRSEGFIAQSVGGGGGNGGFVINGSVAAAGVGSGTVAVGLGGSGGVGGNGSLVTGYMDGSISTAGAASTGLLFQSVGGGGGNGGFAITVALNAAGIGNGSVTVGLGGKGGIGGDGGRVDGFVGTLQPTAVHTTGPRAGGIVMQSVGGGGGNGGFNINTALAGAGIGSGSISVGLGGNGGSGGIGGIVDAEIFADVTTEGADSNGILVQSVGGGGGQGGFDITAPMNFGGVGNGAVGVSLGGAGGAGGAGGDVMADVDGAIHTRGERSEGFIAQSVGGGGGDGGFAVNATIAGAGVGSGTVAVTLGGAGGAGSGGGTVTASFDGSIVTEGDESIGALFQSVGGGGGNGGFAVTAGLNGAGVGNGAVTVGVGGKAGAGGDGAEVTGTVTAAVTTAGDRSGGIVMQSLGGGGGNGGFNVALAGTAAGVGGGAIGVGIGGFGGDGGDADAVKANVLESSVVTTGAGSTAVLLQSVGGGGGNGGFNVSLTGAVTGTGSGAVNVGVGGSGGTGGIGGMVTATVEADIHTVGDDSAGVIAQSIGGGGGNGGFDVSIAGSGAGVGSGAIGVGVGGFAGAGGDASAVIASYDGIAMTEGRDATAILFQSIGGGGGNGGFNVGVSGSGAGTGSGALNVGVGGSGGGAGTSGTLQGSATGTITTLGDRSDGVVMQSIGGGGGQGGFDVSIAGSGAGTGSGSVAVGVGGSAGGGGDGNRVTARMDADVVTLGFDADAVLIQSVGGGGGSGGFDVSAGGSGAGTGSGAGGVSVGGTGGAGGAGAEVLATLAGNVTTLGGESDGVTVQSIGGGGGSGGFSVAAGISGAGTGSGAVSVGVGGSGGTGGSASSVNASYEGIAQTAGDQSTAVLIQSVGGGGGNGGFAVAGSISGAGTGSGTVGVGVGGMAEHGGNAGSVQGRVKGDVTTLGHDARGVVAQSIGGGGGQGGVTVAGGISGAGTGSGAVSVGIGGFGGAGGNASFVEASYTGDAVTAGDGATAVLFQSVGGGGGQGGLSVGGAISGAGTGSGVVSVGVGGAGGTGGFAGNVGGFVTGDIVTLGSDASGVLVQSIGGGGGNGGLTVAGGISGAGKGSGAVTVGVGGFGTGGGNAGDVTSTVIGDVVSLGANSDAIVVQSVGGGGGNGGINVSGAISGAGSGSGAGAVGVGGFGAGGGAAGAVVSGVTGDVVTEGRGSGGVVVQSVGGGGGNGGINVSGAISLARSGSAGVGVGVGGFGGGGGAASTVTSDVTGDVVTEGDDAAGVLAQSLGGGGGNGGINVSGAISASNNGSGAVAVGVGGFGASGGAAGAVVSNATGNILTLGDGSDGFVAQSLGGGGGNGGLNVSGAVNLARSSGGAVGIGVGGFGAGGGNADDVTSMLAGRVETRGADSTGILLQSLGGGGGNGGLNVSGALNLTMNSTSAGIALGVGGFGGGGGEAADVTLAHAGDVLTSGARSGGITAQSLGGGGGNGGINVSAGIAGTNGGNAFAVGLGVGGFGGSGGSAGNVDVAVDGSVFASGIADDEIVTVPAVFEGEEELVPAITRRVRSGGSHGVLAQSVGGGGGNGGLNVSGGIALAKPGSGKSYGLTVGVGGFGGGGGDAGGVTVRVASGGGIVAANGDDASGIAAQSIGGGGGNGGLNVSGGITMDGTVALGVGGFGGDGGRGGDVGVTSDTAIVTAGSKAYGILAQSVGGGGGNGGINVSGGITPQTKNQGKAVSVVFGVGGFGGAADTSGNVTVNHRGDIETAGELSHGILAQSIAGGGGNGSLNVAANASGNSRFAFAGGIGGHGGAGANAGSVTVVSDGNIITRGGSLDDGTVLDFQASSGSGILAQSIGGGGGEGGMNVTGVFALKGSPVSFGLGGFGAGGGDASSVSVTHGASSQAHLLISTGGEDSAGIVAQSIGGGGGNAGANFMGSVTLGAGGAGGGTGMGLPDANRCDGWDPRLVTENCVNWDKVIAELDKRKASKGGKSTVAVQVAIGGRGGEAGHASTATVDHVGNIVTVGDRSEGIVAQSIGGGGGNAAVNIGMAYAGGGVGVNLAVGGAPGDGGTGDDVDVHHEGDIMTSGVDSAGIFAQSIGGGGGDVATNLVRGTTTGGTISVTLGRIGGTGGSAGNVTVSSDGTITTLGDRSVGLLAQSVGNGGGKSGSSSIALGRQGKKPKKPNPVGLTLALGLEGGAGGSAGNVDVTARGVVQTDGLKSHAIFAQSVGGGGGISAMEMTPEVTSSNLVLTQGGTGGTGGTSGTVTVTNFAELLTFGDESKGIFAQSIGGGGGASEMSVAGGWESGAGGAVIALGGDGGTGAVSGAVTVANSGLVVTQGAKAAGIHAQSIGGGGGNGELSFSGSVSAEKSGAMSLSLAIGGEGGSGAAAGSASVTNSGRVATVGAAASGIIAQSIGGGGGNADLESELGLDSDSGSTQLGLSFGGTGGTGGTGGNVDVLNEADGIVTTEGDGSHGIFAQSIGGGGGNSDSKVSTSAISGTQNFGLGFAMGGTGGVGGTGGDVTVANAGLIETLGAGSHGIYAESIGGGGGNGSMHLVSNIELTAIPTATGFNPLLGIGGVGGTGNDGGAVTVTNSGSIVTHGENSHGIVAMSIGGGGGDATLAIGAGLTTGDLGPIPAPETDPLTDPVTEEVTLSAPLLNKLGGTGGEGGEGGQVTVVHTGDIVLWGEGSQAIVAQSVNGGGGNIRFGLTGVTDLTGEAGLFFALGADDAQDSVASRVSVTSTGTVMMMADNSMGHGLQSIGGGGGTLAFDLDLGKAASPMALPIELSLGGTGGVNNGGGALATVHTGDVGSIGRNSHGMFLQSIGGGGGRAFLHLTQAAGGGADLVFALGGGNGANEAGGAIDLQRGGNAVTEGDRAFGTAAQSIGGGGGSVTVELSVPEDGQAADEESAATVADAGDAGVPVRADRLAGAVNASGEVGGIPAAAKLSASAGELTGAANRFVAAVRAAAGETAGPAKIPAPAGALAGAASPAAITLGASSGFGLDGGGLALSLDGDLLTQGRQSHGLFFQSIGAGGGLALVSGSGAAPSITLGGAGEATGDGGDIALVNAGNIWTEGWMAHGVFLQSIGGGGGAVFTDLGGAAADVDLLAGGVGDGGTISFTQAGDIQASGDDAFGIFVQSLGGGGGAVDLSFAGTAGGAGSGGAIDLAIDGSVLALGADGTAIFAQSEGRDGGGDIAISLSAGGSVIGGTGGAGIELRGGNDNSIANRGLLGTLDEVLGNAIVSGPSPVSGNDTIVNFGTVTGSVLLDDGLNLFRNEADAVFNMGPLVDLSGDAAGDPVGSLVNFGTLLAGGFENRLDVEIDGNFIQGNAALIMADYDLSRRSESVQADRIGITGTAELAGTIELALWNPGFVLPGHFEDVLVSAQGGMSATDVELAGVPESVVASFELTYPNASAVVLATHIDFSPGGLNGNQASVGDYVNNIQLAGGSLSFAPLAANLLFTETLGGLQQSYDSLNPVAHAESLSHTLLTSSRFGDQLMDCRRRDGDHRFLGEGECRWFRLARRFLDRDATAENFAYAQDGLELSGGFQAEIAPGRHVALGASFTRSDSVTGKLARGESDLLQLGLTFKQRHADLMLAGVISGGHGWFDTRRIIDVPGIAGIATSSPGIDFFSARGRISHDTPFGSWYLRSIMDAGVNYLRLDAFVEDGVPVVSAIVPEQHRTYLSVQPALEFGGEWRTSTDLLLRPYGRAGVLYLGGENSPQVSASFIGAPAGVTPFTVTAGMDRFYADLALGLDVLYLDGNVFRIESNGQFGDETRAWGVEINWSLAFD